MKRRDFITLLGGSAAWPLAARAARSFIEMGALSQSPDMRTLITEQYLPDAK